MIPKVIHYCWFGGKALLWDVKKCIASWKKYCPDYEIRQWDESNFNVYIHPFAKAAYEAKKWAFVADYARLKIIFDNGGIYLDTDVELLKNLNLLLNHECYMGIAQNGNINLDLGFGAVKGQEMVGKLLHQYDSLIFNEANLITCSMLNTELFVKYGYQYEPKRQRISGIDLYPPPYFDTIIVGKGKILCVTKLFLFIT